ncbi:MAG TPA: alpha/beta hydrolase [Acidimicrobiia bacterium]|nr:alpha/beta hydrolase [Acidimicrobiia bacterium]
MSAAIEPATCTTADGLALEAEISTPDGPARAAAVLCHPHPQAGGTMRSIVISALFDALPRAGVTCLRFNFRGVEGSTGVYDEGRGEQLDVLAAIGVLDAAVDPTLPCLLAGWSFGADIALATVDERIAGWLAIAPPLRMVPDFSAVAADPRPKLLVLAEHDEFREPASVIDATRDWQHVDTEVVGGASHFFVGRTDRLVELALAYVSRWAPG